MRKLSILLGSFLLVGAFSLVGCGGGSVESSSGKDTENPTQSVSDPPFDSSSDSAEENGLTLSANYLVLGIGREKRLVLYKDGEEVSAADVAWKASNGSATVEAGLVTGVAEGECVVTAVYGETSVKATVVVTVIKGLAVAQSEVALTLGGTFVIQADVTQLIDGEIGAADGEIRFTSGNPEIVAVDEEGTLTGLRSGITYVLVQSDKLSCSVTVNVCEEISAAEEFKAKLEANPGGTFLITQDLDFQGKQYFAVPSFSGTLFGCGHRISGLVPVNRVTTGTTEWGGSVFGELTGTVKDLAIEAVYEKVVRETDGAEQLGIQQFGGTVANYLYGTLENVYVKVKFGLYPWWGTNWNECGAICGRLCGNAVIKNCIVDYEVTAESSTLGAGKADIHTLYGMGQDCAGASVENVYIYNRGEYKKEYRGTNGGYFGAAEPRFNGVYEYSGEEELFRAVRGTAMEIVYNYAQATAWAQY